MDNAAAPTFAPGSSFAGYRIESLAGRGGMGIVYRATQVALGRPVALKLLAVNYAADPDFRVRFKREWETAAAIDHPNVIPLYEAGEFEGHLFLAMRFVDGIDLANLIEHGGGVDARRAMRLFAQIAAALDAAHARGLVHRDVKPANVLVDSADHVYLTDFGLSRTAQQSRLTRTGLFVGSVDFAAPEQVRGEGTDARTDVYALGCVLFQLLTGQVPFAKTGDMAKMYAHITEPPPVVTALRQDLPAALDDVIAIAMAKDPADRYQSAGDLARAAARAIGTDSSPGWATAPVGLASIQVSAAGTRTASGWAASPSGARPAEAPAPAGVATATPTGAAPHFTRPAPPPPAPTGALAAPPAPAAPRQTVSLGAPSPGGANPPAAPAPKPEDGSRRTRILLGVGIPVVLVAGLAAAGIAAIGGGAKPAAPQPTATATAQATATAAAVPPAHAIATIKVGKGPDGIAVSGEKVFVANQEANSLSVIDPTTNHADRPIPAGTRPDGVVAGKGVVWVASAGSDAITRFEGITQTAKVKVGDRPEAISLGKQLVWVANRNDGTVNRIDRAAPALVGAPIGVGSEPGGIFVGRRFVWVTDLTDDTVTRIDPSTAQLVGTPIATGHRPWGVIETTDSAWIANSDDGTVSRLERKTGKPIQTITVGKNPRQLAAGFGSIWVTNRDDNTVSRIDEQTGKLQGSPIPVGAKPLSIAAGAGSIWVTNHESHTVTRIQP